MKLTDVAYTLTLATAFAWSGTAFGVNCACEVATGACAECCGAQDAGFKHCGINGNSPLPVPKHYDKAMPAPAELPAADAAAAPEAAPEPYATGDKSPMPDKTPGSTGKDRP